MARPFRPLRLGHFGWNYVDFKKTLPFYTDLLGLIVSDEENFQHSLGVKEDLDDPNDSFLRYGPDTMRSFSVMLGVGAQEAAAMATVSRFIRWHSVPSCRCARIICRRSFSQASTIRRSPSTPKATRSISITTWSRSAGRETAAGEPASYDRQRALARRARCAARHIPGPGFQGPLG
jgi:hypothetical protein